MMLRGIYEKGMADLYRKGFGGIVEQIDHDYKNESINSQGRNVVDTYTPPKTKNEKTKTKNGRAAASILLSGGPSLPDDYDSQITLLLNKSPGLTASQIQKILNNKHKVSESLRRLKENKIVDYDQYFKFYPVQVLS